MSEPKGKKIADASNDQGVVTTFTKGTARHTKDGDGVCLAMTVLWLRQVVEKQKAKTTVNTVLATGLHGFYTIRGRGKRGMWGARKDLFARQSMSMNDTTGEYFFGNVSDAFDWIKDNGAGAYSIKVPGHALAAYYAQPKAYYFDPNWGVYEYDSIHDFCLNAYLHAKYEYCSWDEDPMPLEVFVLPITSS